MTDSEKEGPGINGRTLPRVITLGGEHTITLPLLRSINRAYGPVSVIHFDSHLDTCEQFTKIQEKASRILTTETPRETESLRWITFRGRCH
jgi:arginase family enzyme